jgi:glucokinase
MLAGENRLMHCAIGLDLGGSSAKIALVAQTGEVLAEDRVASPSAPDPEAVLSPIAAAVDRLRLFAAERALPVVALGCGFSGYLDHTRTTIAVNNTPALDGFALAPWLRARFGLPVSIDNDACVAALAATQLTDTADRHRILFITVGSGIGVVLVVDGLLCASCMA